jgi:hypothetical protein
MRLSARQEPLRTPYLYTASMAYCEQVGEKRHVLGGRNGEIRIWYSRTSPTTSLRAIVLFDPFTDPPAESGDLGTDGMEGKPFDMRVTLGPKHEDEVCRYPMVLHSGQQGRALKPECFTHQPTKPVATDGMEPFVGNRVTSTKDRLFRGLQDVHTLDESSARPGSPGEHTVKTLVAAERAFAFHLPAFVTDREFLPSARAATGKNLAAVLGRHTLTEAVGIATLSLVRLICALHGDPSRRTCITREKWTEQHNIMKSDFKFNPGERKKLKNSLAHPPPSIVSSGEGRYCRRCG